MKKEVSFNLGDVVISTAGRDKDSFYLILKIEDKDFVLVVNGDEKKLTNPKKKRIKHLKTTNINCEAIAQKIKEKKKIYDSEIYSAIKNCGIDKK